MQSALRVATVVIGLSMLLGALTFFFAPVSMEPHFSIVASRLDGLGTLRGDLGGRGVSGAGYFYPLWLASRQ